MRIFLDANILFSASKSEGAIRRLLVLLDKAGHECCVDGYVIDEARRNLVAKTPGGGAMLEKLLSRMKTASVQHHRSPALEASLPLHPKDRPVLAAAIHQGCDVLVTGDRTHFGALYGRTINGVTIHSPRSLAETMLL